MSFRPTAAVVAASMLLSAACTGSDASEPPESSPTPTTAPFVAYTPEFVEGPCVVAVPPGARATCGTLRVPEDRTIADGPRVELAVVRIHYDGVDPRPEPVLYLHGGPGGGTLASGINGRVEFGRQMRRDLIVFDQRGTGLSEPSLECPEREAALIDALSDAAAWEIELDAFRTATSACFERLTAEGHDLSQYHTYNNAADVADLRTALGVDDWTLWGTSYGTRVGLAVLRSFPEGVRSVVFDSVYPPDYADISGFVDSGLEAFDRLANGCGTDPNCEATYGDLKALLTRAIASLDAEPFGVDLTLADGTTRRLAITGNDAAAGLFNAMYDTTLIPMLPRVIADIAGGGRSMVGLIAQMGIPAINSITEGAFLSYECADNGARIDQSEVDELVAEPGIASTILLAGWQLFCRDWPVRQLPADFGDEVTSDVPALVFAGEYDPVTPAANSKRAAEALGNATFVQVARSGHGVARESGCTTGLMIKFLDDPTVVDTSCVAGIPFPPFG